MSSTISPELVKQVRNRAIAFNAGLGISIIFGIIAIIVRNGSFITGILGIFGIVGTIVFFLLAGSENESYRRAKAGEAPYAE